MIFFVKNGTAIYSREQLRLTNISPGSSPSDVAIISQTELIVPTETVTQLTSITTGVTLNAKKGIVTTFTPSTAGLAATTFTVTNNLATASSNIEAYVTEYGGTVITDGLPYVFVKNKTAGTFDIIVYNAHATNALATSLKIGFQIKS